MPEVRKSYEQLGKLFIVRKENNMSEKGMNPFNPSFGKLPPIYIDRSEQIGELVEELHNPDSPYQTTLIYGQRGCGKTAFMVA